MAPLLFLALASLLLGGAAAQADSNERQKVWAAVVYINHGETTPQFGPLENILTPEGAQQMFRQGSAFRNRYLTVDNKNPGPGAAPIQNMSQSAINNAQITAMTQTDEYLIGGATAFFQGLYPASNVAYNRDAGGMDVARNLVSGDNLTDFPLGGYQYARVQSLTRLDPDYLAIQGSAGCLAWEAETAKLSSQDDMVQSYRGSYQFYQDLFTSAPLQGLIDPTDADYWNAYQIYELVKYMYSHNNTVFRQLDNANDTLAFLEAHALELDTAMTSSQPGDNDQMSDLAITIAGRTMADKIEYQLTMNAQSRGELNKLTVLFGTGLPMMSFFDIAALKSNDTSADSPFSQLPNPGAAMMFELIGNNQDDLDAMPNIEDLRVRFLYRASADEDAEFTAVGLFGSSGAEQGIPWTDFSRLMRSVGVSPSAWCSICQPTDASWCDSPDGSSRSGGFTGGDSSDGKFGLSPVVAGVIGAVVTLAVTALLGLALFLICGFRLRRAEKDSGNTTVGGFKGAERMPDDKDVAVTKGGAQHERVGSWELRDGAGTPPAFNGAGIVTSDFHRRDEASGAEDDGISVTGARVVNTRESV